MIRDREGMVVSNRLVRVSERPVAEALKDVMGVGGSVYSSTVIVPWKTDLAKQISQPFSRYTNYNILDGRKPV